MSPSGGADVSKGISEVVLCATSGLVGVDSSGADELVGKPSSEEIEDGTESFSSEPLA